MWVVKTLLLDIETAPNTVYVWGMFDQNISHDQVKESSYVLCWSAKWYQASATHYMSVQHDTRRQILRGIHALLDEAEVVVHYNGLKFDIPTLNKEFVKHGMKPPSPYQQVDLYYVVKRIFRFESNKMTAIATQLDLGKKVEHNGFALWLGCMENDKAAWKLMEEYNRHDVRLTEQLYTKLLPWIPNHPHQGVLNDQACPRCGVVGRMQSRGTAVAKTVVYRRYQCQACGGWCRSRKKQPSTQLKYV